MNLNFRYPPIKNSTAAPLESRIMQNFFRYQFILKNKAVFINYILKSM